MMKLASGTVAQAHNRRKGREGSMWEHPYHCTRVQNGRHLLNCLCYVDLNMVRAGKVDHPREWKWCSYDELTGGRLRYRIVDQECLLFRTGFTSLAALGQSHATRVEERLARDACERQACWTEAVAIGDRAFIDEAERAVTYRQSMERIEVRSFGSERAWIVRERPGSYSADSAPKRGL
jgi:putative transposase